jgi:hypothetical protein
MGAKVVLNPLMNAAKSGLLSDGAWKVSATVFPGAALEGIESGGNALAGGAGLLAGHDTMNALASVSA